MDIFYNFDNISLLMRSDDKSLFTKKNVKNNKNNRYQIMPIDSKVDIYETSLL